MDKHNHISKLSRLEIIFTTHLTCLGQQFIVNASKQVTTSLWLQLPAKFFERHPIVNVTA